MFQAANRSIVLDFDNTICEWGDYPEPGKPKKGVKEALQELKDLGFNLLISSSRTSDQMNKHPTDKQVEKNRMEKYLNEHKIPYDEVLIGNKFPATYYIDDRAIEFKDSWKEIVKRIKGDYNSDIIDEACRKDAANRHVINHVIKGEIVCPLCGGTRHYSLAIGDETTSHLSTYCSNSGMLKCKWFTQ